MPFQNVDTVCTCTLYAKPPPKRHVTLIHLCHCLPSWLVILQHEVWFWSFEHPTCVVVLEQIIWKHRCCSCTGQFFELSSKFQGKGVWTCLLILTSAYNARICLGGSILYALFCNLCTKYISNVFCCRTGNVRVLPQKCNGWLFEYLHNAMIFWTLWCTADNMCIF